MRVKTEKEKPLEHMVLNYLDRIPGGYVIKHELSGRPIKKGNYYILIPFKSKFFRRGHSDVTFLYKGTSYYFELKTTKELSWWKKKYETIKHLTPDLLDERKDKKIKHFLEQQLFINNINETGNKAYFVDTLEDVQLVISEALTS
jgi:hypothetical protein